MNDFTNGEFAENMVRVSNLIAAAQKLATQNVNDAESADDVLRAAVMFLHSSMEEIIRNLYLYKLPSVGQEALNKIPFVTQEGAHRSKGILLGDLYRYQGFFVDNVIRESINNYVNTLNINNAEQLAECLKLAEIQVEPLRQFFSQLNSLMKRRHQIVHQMDRANELDPLSGPINQIDATLVSDWKQALEGFADTLFKSVPNLRGDALHSLNQT